MSETKFTKGDWSYSYIDGLILTTIDTSAGTNIICDMLPIDNLDEELANAHLIAASPEMYTMLERALALIPIAGESEKQDKLRFDIIDLLAKARGDK